MQSLSFPFKAPVWFGGSQREWEVVRKVGEIQRSTSSIFEKINESDMDKWAAVGAVTTAAVSGLVTLVSGIHFGITHDAIFKGLTDGIAGGVVLGLGGGAAGYLAGGLLNGVSSLITAIPAEMSRKARYKKMASEVEIEAVSWRRWNEISDLLFDAEKVLDSKGLGEERAIAYALGKSVNSLIWFNSKRGITVDNQSSRDGIREDNQSTGEGLWEDNSQNLMDEALEELKRMRPEVYGTPKPTFEDFKKRLSEYGTDSMEAICAISVWENLSATLSNADENKRTKFLNESLPKILDALKSVPEGKFDTPQRILNGKTPRERLRDFGSEALTEVIEVKSKHFGNFQKPFEPPSFHAEKALKGMKAI